MRPIATLVAALVGAAAVAGGAYALQLSLDRPARATRFAATIVERVRDRRMVYSAATLDGRRFAASCRSARNDRYSLVAFGPGHRGLADWRSGRAFGRRPGRLGTLRNELLLAGCSSQIGRLLSREVRRAFARGRPLRIAPAILGGRRVLRIRIVAKPRLTYLFVDPHGLAPVGIALRTPHVRGDALLDAREPPELARRRPPRSFVH